MTCPTLTWVDDLCLEDDLRLDKMPWVLSGRVIVESEEVDYSGLQLQVSGEPGGFTSRTQPSGPPPCNPGALSLQQFAKTAALTATCREWWALDQTTRQGSGTCPTQHDPVSLKGCGPPAEPHHTAAPSTAVDPGCHHSNPSAGSSRARSKRRDSRRRRARTVPALCSPLLAPASTSARDPLRTGSPPTDKHTGA
ncbi:hypothetical protein NDU88_003196 [Pleurodeles waltl]|uniref:Uncharacterized protein n=1 Tax=Pleurodeles waltl TaxID=8319 RepID=A0AAV7VH78_PLEWA|nr:hypothetical protein NDU88_003196 [Pleurodeles waltl]